MVSFINDGFHTYSSLAERLALVSYRGITLDEGYVQRLEEFLNCKQAAFSEQPVHYGQQSLMSCFPSEAEYQKWYVQTVYAAIKKSHRSGALSNVAKKTLGRLANQVGKTLGEKTVLPLIEETVDAEYPCAVRMCAQLPGGQVVGGKALRLYAMLPDGSKIQIHY